MMSLADVLRRSRVDQSIIRNPGHTYQSRLRSKFGVESGLKESNVSIQIKDNPSNPQQTVINVWQNVDDNQQGTPAVQMAEQLPQ